MCIFAHIRLIDLKILVVNTLKPLLSDFLCIEKDFLLFGHYVQFFWVQNNHNGGQQIRYAVSLFDYGLQNVEIINHDGRQAVRLNVTQKWFRLAQTFKSRRAVSLVYSFRLLYSLTWLHFLNILLARNVKFCAFIGRCFQTTNTNLYCQLEENYCLWYSGEFNLCRAYLGCSAVAF